MDNRPRTETRGVEITVGCDGGELRGRDDRALQAAIDYVDRLGGGTVIVLAGRYDMSNSLFLRAGITLCGEGDDTVLYKCPGHGQALVRDSDWYEASVEVGDGQGYRPGSGVMLRSYQDESDWLRDVVRATVTRVEGQVLTLSKRLRENMWLEHRASAAPLFPLITAEEETHDVTIRDITLDGNRDENEEINGNYSGGVFIQRCDRWTFERVTSRSYNGDGFSFQVCDDIHFDRCRSQGNANLGFHPGSGSQRPVFHECVSTGNSQGIFFCWGVSDGLVERCTCSDNRDYGISIGHRDTDNRVVDTTIERNEKIGVLFREQTTFRSGHRNLITGSTIADNGANLDGVGVDVRGETCDIVLQDNVISDSGRGVQRIGVRIGEQAKRIDTEKNTYVGLADDVTESGKAREETT